MSSSSMHTTKSTTDFMTNMSSQSNSPTSTRPNSPTTTTASSDLFLQNKVIQIKKMMDQIFDNSNLPDYWSTETKRLTRSTIEDMIALQDRLLKKLEEAKQLLRMTPLLMEQLFRLIQNLTQAVDAYERATITASNCRRYLLKESHNAIEALIISDQLRKLALELLNSPELLALTLHQLSLTNSQPSGSY